MRQALARSTQARVSCPWSEQAEASGGMGRGRGAVSWGWRGWPFAASRSKLRPDASRRASFDVPSSPQASSLTSQRG